jgi:DNA mismatch repair protein MutL
MIKRLAKDLVNKIAAGEVVERPASVAKELMENGIDAGADALIIETKAGGKEFLKVIDNGSGMDANDLFICYQDHTTSKIEHDVDLFSVSTLGFRGEALSSIAAVSRIEIASRQESTEQGKKVVVEGGTLRYDEMVGMPIGTQVTVKDLFFNTPARLKHMSGDRVELSRITDIATRYALSSEDISIILKSDGREILNIPKGPMLNKIVTIYGKDFAKQMIPISFKGDGLKVKGYIGKPYLAKKDKSYQTVFVNGRYVKSETVSNALYDAYHTLLFLDRHPVCVLHIEMDFSRTDVNVHPQKEIIRIDKEDDLYTQMFEGIKQTLTDNDLVPKVGLTDTNHDRKPTKQYQVIQEKQELLAPVDTPDTPVNTPRPPPAISSGPNRFAHFRIIGQLNRLYIIAESDQGLVMIDQHAAQERFKFETLMNQYKEKEIQRQTLLTPKLIELSPAHAALVKKHQLALSEMGFTIDEFGSGTFKVSQVPKILGDFTEALIMDTLEELKDTSIRESIEEKIAMKACKASVKAGALLTEPQMRSILNELGSCDKPYACPHGRPTIITITLADLEKKFKRVD